MMARYGQQKSRVGQGNTMDHISESAEFELSETLVALFVSHDVTSLVGSQSNDGVEVHVG